MNTNVIYDFETLSQCQRTGAVLCLAILAFDKERFTTNPYEFSELVNSAKTIRFDIEDQVKRYNRSIQKSTLDWWAEQSAEAQTLLRPTEYDKPLEDIDDFIRNAVNVEDIKRVYTRGNTFDPMFMQYIYEDIGLSEPFPWYTVRDTRSTIDGLAWGTDISTKFFPEGLEDKFVAHNPAHDIAMDVMRIQTLVQIIN